MRFTDNKDREWLLDLDMFEAQRISEEYGVNLLGMDGAAWVSLGSDLVLTFSVIWSLCEEQAVAAGIDAREFARGMVGEAIERAIDALQQSALSLFPSRQRRSLVDLIKKNGELHDEGVRQMLDKLDSDELRKAYGDAIDRQFSQSLKTVLGGEE